MIVEELLGLHPKEMLRSLLDVLQIRPSASIYRDLGQQLSIPMVKQDPIMARITGALERWFPPDVSR